MLKGLRYIRSKWAQARTSAWKAAAKLYVEASIFEARRYLEKNGPITILLDNSAIGHGVTHESVWINTGTSLWGGVIPVPTGYSARIPVHAHDNDGRLYKEVTYLVGLAELAKRGLIKFVTSAELQIEAIRHPMGRLRGYGVDDLNIFDGLDIPSIDGYHAIDSDLTASQKSRVASSTAEPFTRIREFFPEKSNLDAWHLHTAHINKLFCFLAIDFPLSDNFGRAKIRDGFPNLDTRLMLPSELGALLGLRPITTNAISYQRARWAVHPELHVPGQKRQSLRRLGKENEMATEKKDADSGEENERWASNLLPRVGKIEGALVGHGRDAVSIRYRDTEGKLQELRMSLGDAMYLLSILKSTQLRLDIPFPDDPRDPNAKPIRPSERQT